MHFLMSQLRSPYQAIDVRMDQGPAVDGHYYPPLPAQDQTSQRLSHSSDSSIALFTLYLRISEEYDRRKYEVLKGEIDSILVFCGLFSATVAALIMPPIQASENDTPTPTDPYPKLLERVYLLWLCGLMLSIFCALHALLLQRLATPRTWVTSPCCSQPEQARMGVYFAIGIERTNKAVRDLHYIIISSLLVFFSGLLLYFFYLDGRFFIASLALIIAYPWSVLFHKSMISLWQGSPHCTPFAQEKIQEQGSRFDGEVLKRTLDMSRSDDDLEQFFEAIPGFCASRIVDNPRSLDVLGLPKLAEALIAFWNRTLSSNRVSESVKVQRLVTCVRVIEAVDLSIAVPHILHLFSGDLSEVSRSVEIGHSLRPLRNGNAASLSRGIIASIISDSARNDRWSMLAMDELGISGDVLRGYLAHGNSVLLASLIHITRHFFHGLLQPHPDLTREALSILRSVSKFDILNTLPELQRDFCDLWNEVVQQARSSKADDNPFIDILVEIRRLYVDLHGTDITLGYFFTTTTGHDDLFPQPASYPLCIMPDHHPKSTTHTQEASGSTTGWASQSITIAPPILSESSPGDVLDVSHHTATGTSINQGIADTCIPSMAEPVTQSPSSTSGDQPPDDSEGITVSSMVSDFPVIRSDFIR
ncbi:hypothetical protein F5888DRAFT_87207 [Russula emetica]|nr:hypothetical protein F5888DRAFT_87207 [Russula emetica]